MQKDRTKLKIPLLGIEKLYKYFDDISFDSEKEKKQKVKTLEKAYGYYLAHYTGLLKKVLDVFFPVSENYLKNYYLKEKFEEGVNIEKIPLFLYTLLRFEKVILNNSENNNFSYRTAWAQLMYELGEFGIDDIKINLQGIIPNIFKDNNNHYIWWANIPDAGDIVYKIWTERILSKDNDVKIIFIDDDDAFDKNFIGRKLDDGENNNFNYDLKKDKNIYWINPQKNLEPEKFTKELKKYVLNDNEYVLKVFVIDLVYKKVEKKNEKNFEYETIVGDILINEIRKNFKNSLIVAFTAGSSPFVVNSAVNYGADIVIFKNRGNDETFSHGHSPGGNPVGLFDLLWAVSWNVSVWRFLEFYKQKYEEDDNVQLINFPIKFFGRRNGSVFDNVSSFWKGYLRKWEEKINKAQLNRVFKNERKG